MSCLCRSLCFVLLFLLGAGLADAQDKTPPKLFGLSYLAREKSTQKELKMTTKQSDAVQKLIADLNDKYKDDLAKFKELKPAERYKKEGELYKTAGDEANKMLADILGSEQFKRLKQLHAQRRGPYAFSETDVIAALQLTKEQQKKLRDMEIDYQKALLEVNKLTDAEERTKKVTAAIKEAMDKAMTILSDEQKKTWKDLTGERYKGG
jgi:hypothetical protein